MRNSFLSNQQIKALVAQFGTPLFVLSRDRIRHQYQLLKKYLPRVDLFYAVKSNPHPEIINTLKDSGGYFEAASAQEISLLRSLEIAPDRVLFANTVKKTEDIQAARKAGVNITTYDNAYECEKIAQHWPGTQVLLRIKVPNIDSVVDLSLKFGADPTQALDLLLNAQNKGLRPRGLSFHVGSQCLNRVNYQSAIELAGQIFAIAQKAGLTLDVLNIGGGFPISYLPTRAVPELQDIAETINQSLGKYFTDPQIRIMAEPGRFISGPSGLLISKVIGLSQRQDKNWYALNDGVYGTYSGIIFDHAQYQYLPLKKGKLYPAVLAGPSCDSLDVMPDDVYLPQLSAGDLIITPQIGAYSIAHATNFNGLPITKTIVV